MSFALGKLAANNDANRVSVAAKHGIEAIVSAMAKHSKASKVQEWGRLALGNLARNNDANRVSIASKHGVDAVVLAMTTPRIAMCQRARADVFGFVYLSFNESVSVSIQLVGGGAVLEQNPISSYALTALQQIRSEAERDECHDHNLKFTLKLRSLRTVE